MKERLRSTARTLAGTALEYLRPSLARDLDSGARRGENLREKGLILHARLRRARLRGDSAAAQAILAQFWQADTGDFFYDRYRTRFEAWFFGPHQVLIDRLAEAAARHGLRDLVEIGCGDGRALTHCAGVMPGLDRLTGIDINPTIIARNHKTFAADTRLHFANGDAAAWLAANPAPHRALLSYGGVMEYFAPETLRAVFASLAADGPSVVALCEPVAPEHDLSAQTDSIHFGQESSFSHNHAYLLQAEGFAITWADEVHDGGVRWMMMLAERARDAEA
jgi:SAM-dependent methyltransferase